MRTPFLICVLLFCLPAAWAGELKSGLPPGDYPTAFNVADVTGPAAGRELCYRCQYGTRPVVSIFVRQMDEAAIRLIQQIDQHVGAHRSQKMAAFVVLLTDQPHDVQDALVKTAEKHQIRHTPLTVYHNSAGPARYRIHPDAAATILMWVDSDVKANHALRAEEINEDAIKRIIADTSRILK